MKPPVFAELGLADALERSRAENKLLLVDAAAEWCQPCKHMDRMTWANPDVVAALAPVAIAIQIDVDAKPEDAARLAIKAMPTVVVFKDGVELDRAVGMQGPDMLIEWLAGLGRGENAIQSFRREVAERPDDIPLRMRLASRLREGGELDAATDEYLWLWHHMLEKAPSMVGVRHSFLVGALEGLFTEHPPARAPFVELRDAATPSLDAVDPMKLADWLSLNTALGDGQVTLAWYDANTERILADAHLRRAVGLEIIPMLIAADRWADVGRLYDDPVGELRQVATRRDEMLAQLSKEEALPEGMGAQLQELAARHVRESAARIVRALRAAGRANDATNVEEEAARIDGSEDMKRALAGTE